MSRPATLKPASLLIKLVTIALLTTDKCYFTVLPDDQEFQASRLKRLYERDDRSGIRPDLLNNVQEILTVLDAAKSPQAFNLPGYRLHPLKGELKGFWSVTVRANWRIVFRFDDVDAFDVQLIDYH